LLGCAHGDDKPNPAPQFPFSENGDGMADRLDLEGESKDRRIQITKQAVRNRGFLFEHFLQFPHIELSSGNHFEEAHIMQAAGGNFTADNELGRQKK
jgi:hypothetical protein